MSPRRSRTVTSPAASSSEPTITATDAPETVNAAPEAAGWFARLKLANPSEVDALMDRAAYEAYLQTL